MVTWLWGLAAITTTEASMLESLPLWDSNDGIVVGTKTANQQHPALQQRTDQEHRRQEKEDDGIESKIVFGQTAPENRYPYAVSIQILPTQEPNCTGTLIAPDVVLTAPQCVENTALENIVAFIGANNIFNPPPSAQYFRIDGVTYGGVAPTGRVALLKLSGMSTEQWAVMNSDTTLSLANVPMTTMGWGSVIGIGPPVYSPNGLQTSLAFGITAGQCLTVTQSAGRQSYDSFLFDETLCAANFEQGVCTGDIGGPLVVSTNGDASGDILVGTSTFNFLCGQGTSIPSSFSSCLLDVVVGGGGGGVSVCPFLVFHLVTIGCRWGDDKKEKRHVSSFLFALNVSCLVLSITHVLGQLGIIDTHTHTHIYIYTHTITITTFMDNS